MPYLKELDDVLVIVCKIVGKLAFSLTEKKSGKLRIYTFYFGQSDHRNLEICVLKLTLNAQNCTKVLLNRFKRRDISKRKHHKAES